MSRLSNSRLRKRNNKGNHQRRRTTRGHRRISKFNIYKCYEDVLHEDMVQWLYANQSARR